MSDSFEWFDQLQDENAAWAKHNFPNALPCHPVLGIVEELGEFDQAQESDDTAGMMDAIADTVVFLTNACTLHGLCVRPIAVQGRVKFRKGEGVRVPILATVGRLAHAALKFDQKIRGTDEEHLSDMSVAMQNVICYLLQMHFQEIFHHGFGDAQDEDFVGQIRRIWETEVKPRDWTNKVARTEPSGPLTIQASLDSGRIYGPINSIPRSS